MIRALNVALDVDLTVLLAHPSTTVLLARTLLSTLEEVFVLTVLILVLLVMELELVHLALVDSSTSKAVAKGHALMELLPSMVFVNVNLALYPLVNVSLVAVRDSLQSKEAVNLATLTVLNVLVMSTNVLAASMDSQLTLELVNVSHRHSVLMVKNSYKDNAQISATKDSSSMKVFVSLEAASMGTLPMSLEDVSGLPHQLLQDLTVMSTNTFKMASVLALVLVDSILTPAADVALLALLTV
jgi:hypothetical protein